MPVIAPPAGVSGRVEEGGWDPHIADAELQWLRQRRETGDGTLHTQRLKLSRPADFEAVCEHYRAALGEGWQGEWVLEAEGTKEGRQNLLDAVQASADGTTKRGLWEVARDKSGGGRIWMR